MASWDSDFEFPDSLAKTTMDEMQLSQLSDKYAVNITTLKSICNTVNKYFINGRSILITEYPSALRTCILEHFIFKLLQLNSGKIILLHISEVEQVLIPTLNIKYSKLFGGVLTNTLDTTKRIFTISNDQYSHGLFTLIPELTRDKIVYFYTGNNSFNVSLMPGLLNVQNFILASKLLPSSACDIPYSFVHLFVGDHNLLHSNVYYLNPSKTKVNSENSDRKSTLSFPTTIQGSLCVPLAPIPAPTCTPIGAPIDISLNSLIQKHNIPEHTRVLEYLTCNTMECMARGESVVIDGFSLAVLTCLLDYIITKRLETTENCLRTLVDSTENFRYELSKLGVMQTTDFSYVTHDFDYSKRVLFIKLLTMRTPVLNSVLDNCILVSYTKTGCSLNKVRLFDGPIVSLTTSSKLLDRTLANITKTYTRLSHSEEVRYGVIDQIPVHTTRVVKQQFPGQYFRNLDQKLEEIINAEQDAITEPIIIPTVSTAPDTELLLGLVQKHNIIEDTCNLEYMISTVMECIERGDSIAIEGFDKNILTCLLDYIIVKRMESFRSPYLHTIIDSTKVIRKQLINLEIRSINGFNDSLSSPRQVLFTQLNLSNLHLLNSENKKLILINYTNYGDRFPILNLLPCLFVSLSHSRISKELLAKVSRPFLLITYLKDSKTVEYNRLNDFNVHIPNEPQKTSNCIMDTNVLPKKIDQLIDIDSLLLRLSNKYNCYLNSNVCSTVNYFIEEGESLIVDNFSQLQLLYIIDFVLTIKTFRRISFSETKTLILCSEEDLQTKLQVLDVIRSSQYSCINSDGTFDYNGKVLILHDISSKFGNILKERLKLDKSHLLIHLYKKPQGRFQRSFSLMNCNVLGLCVDRTELFPKKKTFIHLTQNEFDQLEVNDCRDNIKKTKSKNFNYPNDDKVTDDNKLKDTQSILTTSENLPPITNPLFLNKQNPITTLICQLFNKHQIELLYTDLPTELYNVTLTTLMDHRNVCIDGFAYTLVTPLLTVFALECVELGIPVKIHYGNDVELPVDKLKDIPVIPNIDIIQTLTENNDPRHLWILIGTDHRQLKQIFSLIKTTHQCIFLLSYAVSLILEHSGLNITRIYKFMDCVFVCSFNKHLLYVSSKDGFDTENLPFSPRIFTSDTPTSPIVPMDITPAKSTETQLPDKIRLNIMQDSIIENSSVKIDFNDVENTDFELSDSCNDLSIHKTVFPELNQEFVVALEEACLPENCTESSTRLINLTGNHTPDIPNTDNLESNDESNLNIICNNSEDNDTCIDSDILKVDSELLQKESDCSKMEEKLSENKEVDESPLKETQILAESSATTNTISTEQVNEKNILSTDYITKLVSEELSELCPVALPDNTIIESNTTEPIIISPSDLGIQLVTSPLQAGLHTILYSTDTTYYTIIIRHIADVLDCLRNTLQVVITSQNPDICSQLLKLASIHLHTARGFLYRAGSIHSLCDYIVQQELQILSIPVSSLVSLIQTDSSLFLDNHILVYVEDPKIKYLDNPILIKVLTKNIAFQYIFILPDKKPRFDNFQSPHCEIKFSDFSKNNESYFVEFNF
ncbi:hypothetical protein LOD99_11676 [Oopsacas minuta]|uniref:Uncharacterized protein n=1 Tax=Oopsacas minuta TaxID=111878 RepID=A0AAV7JLR3_9METZ|nr:hypothetical protein LOD99_11676 [Oopsacas minuta]